MKYLVILGTATSLCEQELSQILQSQQVEFSLRLIFGPVVLIETIRVLDTGDLIQKLGGTIKISHAIGDVRDISADNLTPFISQIKKDRITFGLSIYSETTFPLDKLNKTDLSL